MKNATTKPFTKAVQVKYHPKQVLVALELGETDDSILRYLDFLAAQIPIRKVDLFHVLPQDFFFYELETQQYDWDYSKEKEVKARLVNKIDNLDLNPAIRINYDVAEGNPLEELLKQSEMLEADLLIIGQKANAQLHGIMAAQIGRKSKVDTLIIPQYAASKIQKIVVPIDFSAHSKRALQTAIALNEELQKPAQISILLVHTLPNKSEYERLSKTNFWYSENLKKEFMESTHRFLKDAVTDEQREKISIRLIEKEWHSTAYYIHQYSRENRVDLIVMGAKGHSKIRTLLLGSVTERLLTINDTIPTLIVR